MRKWVFALATPLLATLMALTAAEFVLRAAVVHLPPALLIYVHKDLKSALPGVLECISTFNPWTQGRELDPDTGWTFRKNHEFTGKNEDGYAYSRRSSAEGFFTPDLPSARPQIVTLGDSFASTFYVPQPLVWTMRNRLGMPVYNLAVGGWGPESYRAAFEKFAARLDPKIVVVFSFNNDITDVNNWLAWKKSGSSISFIDWLWAQAPEQDTAHVHNVGQSWLDRHSVIWNIVKFALTRTPPVVPEAKAASSLDREFFPGRDGEAGFELQFIHGYWFQVYDPEDFHDNATLPGYMNEYFDSLIRLQDSIHSSGARMLLVWIPAKERVYIPLLPPERFKRYVKNRSGALDGFERALQGFAEAKGIELFDLTPVLQSRARAGEKLYFTVDGHLNDLGNRVVGEVTADRVQLMLCQLERRSAGESTQNPSGICAKQY